MHGPSHGYDLHQRLSSELGHVWHVSQSQAYAILKRMGIRGDISAHVVRQSTSPPKQMLRITALGRRHFTKWLESDISVNARAIRLEFLTRLYFARSYKPEKVRQIYKSQVAEVTAGLQRLERLLDHLPPEQAFNRLSVELRVRQMRLIRDWMSEIRAQFVT
jgi:DNA-binding PadR family transcriptional regulator